MREREREKERGRERKKEREREREGGVARPIAPKFCSRHFENQFNDETYKSGQIITSLFLFPELKAEGCLQNKIIDPFLLKRTFTKNG